MTSLNQNHRPGEADTSEQLPDFGDDWLGSGESDSEESKSVKQSSADVPTAKDGPAIRQDILDNWIGVAVNQVSRPSFALNFDPFSGSHLSFPVFGKPYDFSIKRPPPELEKQPEPIQSTLARLTKGTFPSIRKKLPDIDWPKSLVLQRERALVTWRILVEDVPSSNELGRQLQDAILDFRPQAFIQTIIDDAFHEKSTSTLLKRGCDLLRFLRWSRSSYGISAFPVEEKKAYLYVKHLVENKAAPTLPAAFKSALAFAGAVIKLDGSLEAAMSGRIVGATNQHKMTKRPRKFAARLTTDMVRMLEHAVMNATDQADRIAAGFFCFMLHGRNRKHDLMFAEKLFLDLDASNEGYLEAAASKVKTARTTELKLLLMPLLAPIQGLLERPWATLWMQSRVEQGIEGFQCKLPTLGINGKFFDHPCDSCTANKWLRKILIDAGASVSDVQVITVHGLKATSLSWMSKFGVPLQDRQLLGRHVPSHMSSALTYSRDELTTPIRKYEDMLAKIRDGQFNPDASRSMLITKKPRHAIVDVDEYIIVEPKEDEPTVKGSSTSKVNHLVAAVTQPGHVSASDSDTSSSASSDSSSEDGNADIVPLPYRRSLSELQSVAAEGRLYVCQASSLVHRRNPKDNEEDGDLGLLRASLACGKLLTRSFIKVLPPEAAKFVGCLRCFKP